MSSSPLRVQERKEKSNQRTLLLYVCVRFDFNEGLKYEEEEEEKRNQTKFLFHLMRGNKPQCS